MSNTVTAKTAIPARRKFSGQLSRWLLRPRQRTAGQRWAAWAHAVSERGRRVTERPGASGLVLARLPLVHRLQQRWFVSSQRFFPRITLAIHPILQQTFWREQTPLSPDEEKKAMRSGDWQRLTTRRFSSWPALLWSTALPGATSRWTVEAAQREIFDRRSNQAFVYGASQPQVPLQLAFRRLFGTDESILVQRSQGVMAASARAQMERPVRQSGRDDAMYQQHSSRETETSVRALVDRIVRQSHRVEERVTESAAVVMRRLPAVETAPAIPTNQHRFDTMTTGQSWRQETTPPPAIDLDRIADHVARQLDRRVVALRERLGKV